MPRASWILPVITVQLAGTTNESRDKEVLSIAPTIKLTTCQYLYFKDVLERLVPAVEHEVDARFRVRFESFAWDGTNSFSSAIDAAGRLSPQLGKQHSTYLTRFASAENLLQGLNSFLIDKQLDKAHTGPAKPKLAETTATKITMMHEQAKGVTRESVLEKIILTMTDR